MLLDDEQFPCPPDECVLWRYMDLSGFLALLREKSIHFSKLSAFEDEWEGSAPIEFVFPVVGQDYSSLKLQWAEVVKNVVVNCWHLNTRESVAMWKLYTRGVDGIAIATTVGRLKESLDTGTDRFTIGSVQYSNMEDGFRPLELSQVSPLMAVFRKRRSYEHEKEIRIVSTDFGEVDDGIHVPINLAHAVMKIVVAQHFPWWAHHALQDLVDRADLNITIEPSDLLRPPIPLY
jgi:hypothetical protein